MTNERHAAALRQPIRKEGRNREDIARLLWGWRERRGNRRSAGIQPGLPPAGWGHSAATCTQQIMSKPVERCNIMLLMIIVIIIIIIRTIVIHPQPCYRNNGKIWLTKNENDEWIDRIRKFSHFLHRLIKFAINCRQKVLPAYNDTQYGDMPLCLFTRQRGGLFP